jgi:hypothetical protein
MMHRLSSNFARASRDLDRVYLVKIVSQFDLICSCLNDHCVFESRHFLELSENILDEFLDDSMSDFSRDDDSSGLRSLDSRTSANFTFDR